MQNQEYVINASEGKSVKLTNKKGEIVAEASVRSAVGINEVVLTLLGDGWTLSEMSHAAGEDISQDNTVLILTS